MVIQERALSDLVLDFTLYPRHIVDGTHVAHLQEAIHAGAELPPILIDKKTKRIVDGVHRYKAHLRALGDEGTIRAEVQSFRSEAEMFLEAARRNAGHGRRLTTFDRLRCIQLATQLDINEDALAGALMIPVERVASLRVERMSKPAVRTEVPTALKRTIAKNMAGKRLNKKQIEANRRLSGMRAVFYVNQVIHLLESFPDVLLDDTEGRERLQVLSDLLGHCLDVRNAG